jgi:hypothetical protein
MCCTPLHCVACYAIVNVFQQQPGIKSFVCPGGSDRLEYNVYILVLFSHKMALLSNVVWNIINISTNILIEFGDTD